jgi:hypothetical protein
MEVGRAASPRGHAVVVSAGTYHNVLNTSKKTNLKLYTKLLSAEPPGRTVIPDTREELRPPAKRDSNGAARKQLGFPLEYRSKLTIFLPE